MIHLNFIKKSLSMKNLFIRNSEKNILQLIKNNEKHIKKKFFNMNKNQKKINCKIISNIKDQLNNLDQEDIIKIFKKLSEKQSILFWNIIDKNIKFKTITKLPLFILSKILEKISNNELLEIFSNLKFNQKIYIADNISIKKLNKLLKLSDQNLYDQIHKFLKFPKDSISRIMNFQYISINYNNTIKETKKHLLKYKNILKETDKIFVVDFKNRLKGELPLNYILTSNPNKIVKNVMKISNINFHINEKIKEVSDIFKKHKLTSAAVIDKKGFLIGQINIKNIEFNYREKKLEKNNLQKETLIKNKNVFFLEEKSNKNRWIWLIINLFSGFTSSKIINVFENTISKFIVLATLMPIVAGIAGNSGNQTATIIIRAISLNQKKKINFLLLFLKELKLSLMNGIILGTIASIIVYSLYKNIPVAIITSLAIICNLISAAIMGVCIPLIIMKLKKDPAIGSGIIITAITDTGGFFIFLGLATIFLL